MPDSLAKILPEWAGRLVPGEDARGLAEGLGDLLERWNRFDRARMRAHAVGTWGRRAHLAHAYREVLS
jgi:hypothetical protein